MAEEETWPTTNSSSGSSPSSPISMTSKRSRLLADDMRFTNPISGVSDKEGMRNIHSTLFKAFPDIRYGVDHMIVSGNTYVMECTLTGTHQGSKHSSP